MCCGDNGETPYLFLAPLNFNLLAETRLTWVAHNALMKGMSTNGAAIIAGKPGTGKTETALDFARSIGRQAFNFKCSSSMSVKIMKDILTYLDYNKACVGVYDEFNRISSTVLSALASFLGASSRAGSLLAFTFNPELASKITMEFGKVYYTTTLEVSDYGRLSETLLVAEGMPPDKYTNNEIEVQGANCAGEELAALFEWGQKNLSTQVHYDYGFRTINFLARMFGDRYRNLRRFAFYGDKKGPNAIDNIQLIRQLFLSYCARVVTLEDAAKLKKVFKTSELCDPFEDSSPEEERAIRDAIPDTRPATRECVAHLLAASGLQHAILCLSEEPQYVLAALQALHRTLPEDNESWARLRLVRLTNGDGAKLYGEKNAYGEWIDGQLTKEMRDAENSKEKKTWFILQGKIDQYLAFRLRALFDNNKVRATFC